MQSCQTGQEEASASSLLGPILHSTMVDFLNFSRDNAVGPWVHVSRRFHPALMRRLRSSYAVEGDCSWATERPSSSQRTLRHDLLPQVTLALCGVIHKRSCRAIAIARHDTVIERSRASGVLLTRKLDKRNDPGHLKSCSAFETLLLLRAPPSGLEWSKALCRVLISFTLCAMAAALLTRSYDVPIFVVVPSDRIGLPQQDFRNRHRKRLRRHVKYPETPPGDMLQSSKRIERGCWNLRGQAAWTTRRETYGF